MVGQSVRHLAVRFLKLCGLLKATSVVSRLCPYQPENIGIVGAVTLVLAGAGGNFDEF